MLRGQFGLGKVHVDDEAAIDLAEPEFRQRLLQLATQLSVIDHLQILHDNTPEFIRDAYRAATIVTHPSFVESFGMVLLEAMTAGVPVVAHNGTGIPCVIDDGINGFVVDVRDTPKYTEALLSLLNDPVLRQRMGCEGRRQAETRFSQAEVAGQLFAICAEVTGPGARITTAPQLNRSYKSIPRQTTKS